MKILSITLVIIALLGLLAYKNPTMDDYNDFVSQFVLKEVQKEFEKKKQEELGQMLPPILGKLAGGFLASQTVRTDCIFFSLYEAQFGKKQLKLLGILNRFIILKKPDFRE